MKCCIDGCKSYSDDRRFVDGSKVSFHAFPNDTGLKQQWIQLINKAGWSPTKYSKVCSLHFNAEDILNTKKGLKKIKEGACPNIPSQEQPIRNQCPGPSNLNELLLFNDSPREKILKHEILRLKQSDKKKVKKIRTLTQALRRMKKKASLGSQRVVKGDTTLPDTSPRVLPVPVSQKAEAAGSLVYNAKVPATSAGLRCAECGGAVAGRVFACVQCAGAGLCAACGGGAGGRHRRHAVLRLPSRRIYNKVRDLFESLQKEFAKLGLDDASDDESLNSDDDEVPIGNDDDDDDDEEESKDWEQSLTVPVTSSPSRKRKRKTKSYASTAPKDISRATATEVTNEDSNIMDDTDVDEPLVLFKQPPLDDHPDPLSEVKIEPDEPPEETAAVVITEVSVVKSGIISEVPTTVQTNKEIKVYKTYSVKTKRRSGLNEGTSRETDAAAEDRARAEIKTKVKEEPPEEMAEGEDCSSFIEYGSHKPTKS